MSTRLFTKWGLVGIVAIAMLAPQLALAGTPRLQLNSDQYRTGDPVTLTVTNADANIGVIVVASNWAGDFSNPQMNLGTTDGTGRWVSNVFTITRDFRSSCNYKIYVIANGKQSNTETYCVTRTSENPSGVHGYVVETQNSFQYVETSLIIDGRKSVSTSGGFYETRDLEPGRHTITVLTPSSSTEKKATEPEYNVCSGGADCGRNGNWQKGDTATFDVTEGNIATVYFRFLITNHDGNPNPGGGTEPEPCNATYGSCSAGQVNTYRCSNAINYQKCERVDKNNDGFAIYCWNAPAQCPVAAPVCTGGTGTSITDDPSSPIDTPVCATGTSGPTPSEQFSAGQQIEITQNGVNVRGAPGGSWAATRNAGAKGTIYASPAIPAKFAGIWYQWWKVDFGNLLGWVAEDFLRLAGTSANTFVDAGTNVTGTFSRDDGKLYAYLNGSVYVNGAKRDDIQNNGFIMWKVSSKDGAACGGDNCGVTFENPGNQGQDPTVVFPSRGNYQLQFCAPYITPCDSITADIRQGGTQGCNDDLQRQYLAEFCPHGFDPTKVTWGGAGGISGNPWGPYHACNIRNLPAGGITAGGCHGKYQWPNGGDDTTSRTPSTPPFNDGVDAYGYAHLVAEAWNPNWTRALNLNGIPTRSGQWNLAARYLATRVGQDGPYKWLGIPAAYSDFLPKQYVHTYVSPEALAAGPGQMPLCMQDYSVNAQVYGMAKGWWGLPSGMNPDGSRPGRRIPQTGKCVPDWRSWRPGLDAIPQYTGGPGPGAANGSCGGPVSTADEVVCRSEVDQFYCTANKTTAAIGEAVTFTAFGATPLEWNAELGTNPRTQSGGQSFTTTWTSVHGSFNQGVSFTHRTDGSVQTESCSVLLYDPNPAPPPPPPAGPSGPLACSGGDATIGTIAGTVTLRAFDVRGTNAMSFGVYPVRNGDRKVNLAKWPGGTRVGASNTFRGTLTAAQLADGNFGDGRYGVDVWLWGPDVVATSDDIKCATFDFVKTGNTVTIPGVDNPPPPPPPPPAGPLPPPSCTLTPTPAGTTKAINTRFNVTWAYANADYITVSGPGWSGTVDCGLHDDNGDGIGDRFDANYTTPYSCRAAFLRTTTGGSYDLGTSPGTWGNLYMREIGTASVTATPKRRSDGAVGAPCTLTMVGTQSGGVPPPPPPPPAPACANNWNRTNGGYFDGDGAGTICGCDYFGPDGQSPFGPSPALQCYPPGSTGQSTTPPPPPPPAPATPRCKLNNTFGNSSITKTVGSRFEIPWGWENADYVTVSGPGWNGTIDCGKRADGTYDPNYFPYPYKCRNEFMRTSNGSSYNLGTQSQWGNLYMREAGTASVTITPKRNNGTAGASCTLTITGTGTLVAPPPPPPPPPAAVQAPTYNNRQCSVTSVTQLGGGRVKLRVVGGTVLPDSVGFWNLSRGVGTATWIGRGSWTTINSTTFDVTVSAAEHANTYGRYQANFWKWGTSDATNVFCADVRFDIPRPTAALSGSDANALANTLQGLRNMLLGLQAALGQ